MKSEKELQQEEEIKNLTYDQLHDYVRDLHKKIIKKEKELLYHKKGKDNGGF